MVHRSKVNIVSDPRHHHRLCQRILCLLDFFPQLIFHAQHQIIILFLDLFIISAFSKVSLMYLIEEIHHIGTGIAIPSVFQQSPDLCEIFRVIRFFFLSVIQTFRTAF